VHSRDEKLSAITSADPLPECVYLIDQSTEGSADGQAALVRFGERVPLAIDKQLVVLDLSALRPRGQVGELEVRLHLARQGGKEFSLLAEVIGVDADASTALLDAVAASLEAEDPELEALRAELQGQAVQRVLDGARWLTSADVNAVRNRKTTSPAATITRWLDAGKVFAIKLQGQRRIPDYALDPSGEPVVGLQSVLAHMAGTTGFQIAAWFESPNSVLDGRRPRELLATSGERVAKAAQVHAAAGFQG